MEDTTTTHNSLIPKYQSTPKEMTERRSLQTLQATPSGNGLNGGRDYAKDSHTAHKNKLTQEHEKHHLPCKSLSVYHDPKSSDNSLNVHCSRGTQTEKHVERAGVTKSDGTAEDSAYFDQEAYDLMASESIPETYWQQLAEERRRALNESLEENRRLSLEIGQLKEENSRLSCVAQEAKELRELLQGVLSDDEDSAIKSETSADAEQSFPGDQESAVNYKPASAQPLHCKSQHKPPQEKQQERDGEENAAEEGNNCTSQL